METVERTTQLTVDQVLQRIRIDKETGKGSVLDVVGLVTGCDQSKQSRNFSRIEEEARPVRRMLSGSSPARGGPG